MLHYLRIILLLCLFSVQYCSINAQALPEEFEREDFVLHAPALFILGHTHYLELTCQHPAKLLPYGNLLPVVVNGEKYMATFEQGIAEIPVTFDRNEPLSVKVGNFTHVQLVSPMPLWWSVVPPLLVIFLALLFREVLGSLLVGIFAGAMISGYFMGGTSGIIPGFFSAMDGYLVDAFYDRGHISVVLFSTVIGGIVALISKNGGMQAVVNAVSKKATTAKSGQLATWYLGMAIFFDDYANTLVVGNAMRSLTDKLRVSREKLAYIVDSTAAPVAAIALITTWIGAELGYIEGALGTLESKGASLPDLGAYAVFLSSLEYAFYPIFCLAFIMILILMQRDFGPMYRAEVHARNTKMDEEAVSLGETGDEFSPVPGVPLRKINALLPLAIVIFGTITGLFVTGHDASVWADSTMPLTQKFAITVGNSDSYKALLWASMSGLIVAVLITAAQGIMTYATAVETAVNGFKTMVSAVVILLLAWALASLTEQMHTADYLASLAGDSVAPWAVPAITFVLAAVVSFSTGSAWGTMAIVYPLMLPLSWELSMASGLDVQEALPLFFNVTSCVLAGAVLGDHCSPISDTTILSSLATQCDHIEHVRTQLPYAITAGLVSVLFTTLSAAFGLPWYLNFILGILMLMAVVRIVGRKVEVAV
jgi:Na+/H+ antiporter NhaC